MAEIQRGEEEEEDNLGITYSFSKHQLRVGASQELEGRWGQNLKKKKKNWG
jgi:hypothetical protein